MPTYGVIDLGSNSIRLVIYDIKDDNKPTYIAGDFKSIINDKVIAGLSAYVVNGVFSTEGVARAVSVLKGHAKRARYFGCKQLDVFATAVLRNASNCDDAIKAIESDTGLSLTLLSAQDEAHLGFVGATCDRSIDAGTLVDIGGGSTELTTIAAGKDHNNISLAQGSLSSYAAFVETILPTRAEMKAIEQAFQQQLQTLPDLQTYASPILYGVGGSVRAASKMHAQLHGLATRPKTLTIAEVNSLLDLCSKNPASFAHHALKASAERIHTLGPGCIILGTLMKQLGAQRVEIGKYGVREGYLLERMLPRMKGQP